LAYVGIEVLALGVFRSTAIMSHALVPHTGELIEIAAMSVAEIATLTDEIRDLESRLRSLKSDLAAEVTARFDRDRSWNASYSHAGVEWKVSTSSDAEVSVWDVTALQELLYDLVEEGLITEEASKRTVVPKIEYKVMASGVNALLKSPEIAARIEACRTLEPQPNRRLKVERK